MTATATATTMTQTTTTPAKVVVGIDVGKRSLEASADGGGVQSFGNPVSMAGNAAGGAGGGNPLVVTGRLVAGSGPSQQSAGLSPSHYGQVFAVSAEVQALCAGGDNWSTSGCRNSTGDRACHLHPTPHRLA